MNKEDIINTYVDLTSQGMTQEEILIAKKLGKQMAEIAAHCMAGRVKLTAAHVDSVMGVVFPIFSNDNLESITERYLKLYPIEAKLVLAEFQEKIKENETGFSAGKLMKLRTRVPSRIHLACKAISPNFWEADNGKMIDRFIALCPKLSTRNKHAIK